MSDPASNPAPPRRLWVLLLEDDPEDAARVVAELDRRGLCFTSERVRTEAALRQQLAAQTWDILLSTHELAGFSAVRALEVLSELGIPTPLIVVSGPIGEQATADDMLAGAKDFVLKSKLARLVPALRREVDAFRDQGSQPDQADLLRLLRLLLETLPVGVGLADSTGVIRWLNDALLAPGGYSEQDFARPRRVQDLYADPLDRERLHSLLAEQGIIEKRKVRFKKKGGGSYPARMSVRPVAYAGQACTLAIVEDLTTQVEGRAALRTSEKRFRDLASATIEGIAFIDAGAIVDANPQFAAIFGYPERGVIGLRLADLLAPSHRHLVRTPNHHKHQPPSRALCVKQDGTIFPAKLQCRSLVRKKDHLWVAAVSDLTEVERTRQTLQTTAERQTALLEMASVALYTRRTDGERSTTWISDNVLPITGFGPDAFIDDAGFWTSRVHPHDIDVLGSGLEQQLARHDTYTCEYRWKHADETYRWLLDRGRAIRQPGTDLIELIGTIQDISELKNLQRQLAGAQRMDTVGRLAGGVAHDFNNLLTVIQAFTGFVRETLRADDPVCEDLEEVSQAAERGAALTRQLLAFSRQQTIDPQVLRLSTTLDGLDKMLGRLIGEDIDRTTIVQPDLWSIFVDQGAIEQVIMNLVLNSRDAMPKGGQLTIEASNVTLDKHAGCSHDAMIPAGDYVLLAISDTGCGMDRPTRERIFEPFFSTKGKAGTGLGLSTTYGIVKQANGFIWAYSEVGMGSAFRVYLPRATQASFTRAVRAIPKDLAGTETVLVAEDERAVRLLTVRTLTTLGYTVVEAADGAEALQQSENYKGTIHLLLTDLVMPRMSGSLLALQMQPRRPGMKVLYMTGYTNEAVVRHGLLQAGVEIIQKPFSPAELAARVRMMLGGPDSTST
ncbi:MAG: PAS domain S-box protein [Oligoflexia bacterium]|nr:PAS domain S-box protein [Oligoflexia bacterium]